MQERLDEYKRLMTLGRALGVESHVLTPQETKKLYPLMNVSDVHGSLYCPGSGTWQWRRAAIGIYRLHIVIGVMLTFESLSYFNPYFFRYF